MTDVGIGIIVSFINVAVKHREADEESNADKIFHAFDVRVIIYQSKNFFEFA